MLTFIFLGAGVLIIVFLAIFVMRGNSPAGRGKSADSASRTGEQQTPTTTTTRASGPN